MSKSLRFLTLSVAVLYAVLPSASVMAAGPLDAPAPVAAEQRSEVFVSIDESRVRVRAERATLREVLSVLQAQSGAEFQLGDSLGDTPKRWLADGPDLQTAVKRLLRGFDYILVFARNDDGDNTFSGAIILMLGESSDKEVAPVSDNLFVPLFAGSGDAPGKPAADAAAVWAMQALPPEDAVAAAEKLLRNSTPHARMQGVAVLGRVGSDRAVMMLGQVAVGDHVGVVRAAAVAQLRELSTEHSMIFVKAAQTDADAAVRRAAGASGVEADVMPVAAKRPK